MELRPRIAATMAGAAFAVAAVAIACTASDPLIGLEKAGEEDAGIDAAAVDPADAASEAQADAGVFGTCPTSPQYLPCAVVNPAYGSPVFRLDACALPQQADAVMTSWTAVTGQVLQGDPGALFCRGGLRGRPAIMFDKHGFVLPSAEAVALNTFSQSFLLVAVLEYTPSTRAENTAGGIVFQRNDPSYPFDGPQLIANFAWQSTGNDPQSLAPSTRIGGSLRFGLDPDTPQAAAFPAAVGHSAVAPNPYTRPIVVAFRNRPSTYELFVDGVASGSRTYSGAAFGFGDSRPVAIGRAPGSENNYFLGMLSELVYYNADVPDTQMMQLVADLGTKWGVTP